MFFSEQTLRIAIHKTPEGDVFHPWGTLGDGYLVDAPIERRLARFLDGWLFGQAALAVAFVRWGSATGHVAVAMAAFLVALMAIRYLCLRHILRDTPRTHARFAKVEALQRAAAEFSVGRIALTAFVLLLLPLGLLLAARNESRVDFAVMVAMYVAVVSYGIYVCVRLLRIKAALGRSSTPSAE